MPQHFTKLRQETRAGMRSPEYRIICSCGWEEKAQNLQTADRRATTHRRDS